VHRLAQRVLDYIRRRELLHPGDRLAIALSGGRDSVGLWRLMLELESELGVLVTAVHLNHQLRGPEADRDEEFVRDLARRYRLPFVGVRRDVKAYAAEKKLGLEAAARALRYQFFRSLLEERLDAVATAHTMDDQAETVLLKLSRGAGTRGLGGIYPRLSIERPNSRRPAAIIRPLLSTSRHDLRSYLVEIGQSWCEDRTNWELDPARNRLRHHILPRLEAELNPAIVETLSEAAEIAQGEEEYWTNQLAGLLASVWAREASGGGALKSKPLALMPLAARRRLLRGAAETLGLTLGFRHVEEILQLRGEGDSVTLPGGWVARVRHGEWVFKQHPSAPADYQYNLPVPGKIAVTEAGVELEARLVARSLAGESYNPEDLLDPRWARKGLAVRNWRAGERFWPAHRKEPKKIKELLAERHIAGEEKKSWPVAACGTEVVWIRGLGVHRDFQAKAEEGVLIRELPLRDRRELEEGEAR
jgi:tRNA(Ile)-lysidine synthase